MKIEKINDNQIRCTLTKEDLETRQLHLSELAYGTDKAKKLFRDMMLEAQAQFGFQADNIPLMIEAIPLNGESILLIITKVEDPEELDTRFSKFSPFRRSDGEDALHFDGADNILDIIQKLCEAKGKGVSKKPTAIPSKEDTDDTTVQEQPVNLVHLFVFSTLDDAIAAAHGLGSFYNGVNTLYKDNRKGVYTLVLHQTSSTPEEFNKICNILSEYGTGKVFSAAGEAHLSEHAERILFENALQQLEQL